MEANPGNALTKSEDKPEEYAGENATTAAEALGELYELNMPRVFRYISYRVGDTYLAQDLTSTVFEKVLKGFGSYRSDKASSSTWLIAIARNTVIDYYRSLNGKQQVVALDEANEIASSIQSPGDEAIRNDDLRRLYICLAGLSQDEREIISLKFGAELTNRQIARMLGFSESRVGTRLYRAVLKLRDKFEE